MVGCMERMRGRQPQQRRCLPPIVRRSQCERILCNNVDDNGKHCVACRGEATGSSLDLLCSASASAARVLPFQTTKYRADTFLFSTVVYFFQASVLFRIENMKFWLFCCEFTHFWCTFSPYFSKFLLHIIWCFSWFSVLSNHMCNLWIRIGD